MGGCGLRSASPVAKRGQGGCKIGPGVGQCDDLRALGGQDGGLARIGEESDGRARPDQHDPLVRGQHLERDINGIGHARDTDPPCPAIHPRIGPFRQKRAARSGADASGKVKIGLGQSGPAQQQQAVRTRQCCNRCLKLIPVEIWARCRGQGIGHNSTFGPCRVGGQDQGRHLPRRGIGGLHRLCRIMAKAGGIFGRVHPMRDRPGDPLNIGGQWRIQRDMAFSMFADDVQHA